MALTNQYNLQGAMLGTQAIPLESKSINPGVTTENNTTGGSPFVQEQHILAIEPVLDFSTKNIAKALGVLGTLGADLSVQNVTLYDQQHALGGIRQTGSTGISYAATLGMVIPISITANHRGVATLQMQVIPVSSDGVADPFVKSINVSLPSGVFDSEHFTIGTASVGGNAITAIESIQINFGISADPRGSDSTIFNTFVSIMEAKPSIIINTLDLNSWPNDIGLNGTTGTHANTSVKLRKWGVSDATAEHIEFTTAGLATIQNGSNGSHNQAQTASFIIEGSHDGTNDPLIVNTAVAI